MSTHTHTEARAREKKGKFMDEQNILIDFGFKEKDSKKAIQKRKNHVQYSVTNVKKEKKRKKTTRSFPGHQKDTHIFEPKNNQNQKRHSPPPSRSIPSRCLHLQRLRRRRYLMRCRIRRSLFRHERILSRLMTRTFLCRRSRSQHLTIIMTTPYSNSGSRPSTHRSATATATAVSVGGLG